MSELSFKERMGLKLFLSNNGIKIENVNVVETDGLGIGAIDKILEKTIVNNKKT